MYETISHMPSKSEKQAHTAQLAGAVKAGKFPISKAGPSVRSMAKMPMDKLKHFMKVKESMTIEQKKRLLNLARRLKEEYTGNVGGETDIRNPDNLMVAEDEDPARNVIAKTFDTKADFDSYVNQRRGIEFTSKEIQSIYNYKETKPSILDKFYVKYESTDEFGNNDTTIIKKLREGNQFCFTAFSKHETAEEEGKPEGAEEAPVAEQAPPPATPAPAPAPEQGNEEGEELTVNDPIRITKTVTFTDETEGANILSHFLMKLDV